MAAYAARYARALQQVVLALHLDAATLQEQLGSFAAMLAESRDLNEVFKDPSIPNEQKLRILDAIGSRLGWMPQARNFIAVIIAHRRVSGFDHNRACRG